MMQNNNFELFKMAITEGLSNRIDKTVEDFSGEITVSRKHALAMRTIVYGKAEGGKGLSTRAKILIAILVAAALLLTSCGIIFHNELEMFFKELYVAVMPSSNDANDQVIEEVYSLSYVPEGYTLEETNVSRINVEYTYYNSDGEILTFYQNPYYGTIYTYDTENSETEIVYINSIKVYHTRTSIRQFYLWDDGKYVYEIGTSEIFSIQEIENIIKGLVCEEK